MKDIYHRFGPLIISLVLLYFSIVMLKPFIIPFLTVILIAYVFFPLNKKLSSKIKNKNILSILMIGIVALIVVIPSLYIASKLVNEIPNAYSFAQQAFQGFNFQEKIFLSGFEFDLKSIVDSVVSFIITLLQQFLTSIPSKILYTTLGAFFLFFVFRDGAKFVKKLPSYLPFGVKKSKLLLKELKNVTDAVVYGQIITAGIQAGIATIAFLLLGLKAPLVLGALLFVTSLIPLFGPAVVYIPLSAMLVGSYFLADQQSGLFKGIFLLIYGLTIISSVDNFVKPIFISGRVKLHPILIIIGVIGGLRIFGFIGVAIGPIILSLLAKLFEIYEMKDEIIEH